MVGAAIRLNEAPSAKWYLVNSLYTTLGFELLVRNIAPLLFKTQRLAEIALRKS